MKPLITLAAMLLGVTAGWAQAPAVDGEVVRIDKAQGRVTLRHGEIRHLDMPPMTMVWRIADGVLPDGVAVGDRVRFQAARIGSAYTVTSLVKAPARVP